MPASSYEELKQERNRQKALMEKAKGKNSVVYKVAEYKYQQLCEEIKKLFRK